MKGFVKLTIISSMLLTGLIFAREKADVQVDLDRFFSKIVIDGDNLFSHTAEGDDDMPAHIRTALTQTNLSIPIRNHQLLLGQWQGIFIFEHRFNSFKRKVHIHLIGE